MLKLGSLETFNPFQLKKVTLGQVITTTFVINNTTVHSSHRLVGPFPVLFMTGPLNAFKAFRTIHTFHFACYPY